MNGKKSQKVVVLATGGTIAGTSESGGDHTSYIAAQLSVQQLLDAIPALRDSQQGDALVCEQVAQLDSKDMDHATWQALAQRCMHWLSQADVDGIVITHGTDTLEETAWFLQLVLGATKPVVLTCAMRPATAVMPDGPQNLMDAITVARDPMAHGVLAVCAGRVHSARDVQKVHPYRLDAFSSGEAGPSAWVEQGLVRWSGLVSGAHAPRQSDEVQAHVPAAAALQRHVDAWPWVAVLHSHAGADARQVQALMAAGVKGLVVAGTGNGTVSRAWHNALEAAQSQGVVVHLTSRCSEGQLVGQALALATAPRGLNAFKARVSLMLALMVSTKNPA